PGLFATVAGPDHRYANADDRRDSRPWLRCDRQPGQFHLVPPFGHAGQADLRGTKTPFHSRALHELRGSWRRPAHQRRNRCRNRQIARGVAENRIKSLIESAAKQEYICPATPSSTARPPRPKSTCASTSTARAAATSTPASDSSITC